MRRTREEAAESRQRIVTTAARMVRQGGIDGLGVAEVMKAVGMTHGGFYRHFASKDALVAEALDAAFDDLPGVLDPGAGSTSISEIQAYVDQYLSAGHVAHPEIGCPLAAIGGEVGRGSDDARETFSRRAQERIEMIAAAMEAASQEPRADAIRLLATMIGAVVLARSVQEETSRTEIIEVARVGLAHHLAGSGGSSSSV